MLNYTLDELQAMPTLCTGQADDLKVDTGDTRIWLSRVGVADGMPTADTVTVEVLHGGKWRNDRAYGFNESGQCVLLDLTI